MIQRLIVILVSLAIAVALLADDNSSNVDTTMYEVISTSDTLYRLDSIIVIHTVCAPICSSCARVYNKEWQFLGNLTPPIKTAFPEAYIEDGKLLWRDNDTFDYTPAP